MKGLTRAVKIGWMGFKSSFQYGNSALGNSITFAMRCMVLLLLYRYTFAVKGGVINGTTYGPAAWSMFLYFLFMMLSLRKLAKVINQDVLSGQVEMFMTRPMNYLSYRLAYTLGEGIGSLLVTVPLAILCAFWLVGKPDFLGSGSFWLTLPFVLAGGIALSLFMYGCVGMASFWINDNAPLHWLVDKSTMILGGSYLPIALFPPLMKAVAIYSPFGASQFITHMPMSSWAHDAWGLIAIQWGWALILGSFLAWLYKCAAKRITVNGG
jgi:ABC-2 type transport system permease protein